MSATRPLPQIQQHRERSLCLNYELTACPDTDGSSVGLSIEQVPNFLRRVPAVFALQNRRLLSMMQRRCLIIAFMCCTSRGQVSWQGAVMSCSWLFTSQRVGVRLRQVGSVSLSLADPCGWSPYGSWTSPRRLYGKDGFHTCSHGFLNFSGCRRGRAAIIRK